jgi:two-component system KDP operon response regulator KdpE
MEQKATVLIVEDDRHWSYLLAEHLKEEGYRVLRAVDGVEGLRAVQSHNPDLVVLDVLMPRMDGWEACRLIRFLSDVPIVIVSCRGNESDRVRGLSLGADDYMPKPVSLREFSARISAVLRRAGRATPQDRLVRVDDRLVVDRARREVYVEGEPINLSGIEYKLLACFLDNIGRLQTHKSLLIQVWGWEYSRETNYLKVYIHHLRKKIERDPKRPRYILTERGLGYSFQIPPPA